MKKILKMILIFLVVLLIKLVGTFIINEIIIFNYNHKIYNSMLIKSLYFFNVNEPYIAYYNEGNIMYKKKNYDGAIKKYKEAISLNPPNDKICDIRINLAIAMIDNTSVISGDVLDESLYTLYKNNCANPNDNSGNSKEAEELEEKIKKLKDNLNNSNNNDPTYENEPEEEGEEESEIEEELKEIEKNSNSSRQDELSTYENIGGDFYSGKNW